MQQKESKASTSASTQREYSQGVLCAREKSKNHVDPIGFLDMYKEAHTCNTWEVTNVLLFCYFQWASWTLAPHKKRRWCCWRSAYVERKYDTQRKHCFFHSEKQKSLWEEYDDEMGYVLPNVSQTSLLSGQTQVALYLVIHQISTLIHWRVISFCGSKKLVECEHSKNRKKGQ